jgi:hypothetical protein
MLRTHPAMVQVHVFGFSIHGVIEERFVVLRVLN